MVEITLEKKIFGISLTILILSMLWVSSRPLLYVLLIICMIPCGLSVLYMYSERMRRAVFLWKSFLPIYLEYRLAERKVKQGYFVDQEQEDAMWEALHTKSAPKVKEMILELEGVFYKVGQIYGTRRDFVPDAFHKELKSLVDKCPPKPWELMKPKILKDLDIEISDVFEEFDEKSIAAASIAQVYKGTLKKPFGDIKKVVLKTTYPNGEHITRLDMLSFKLIARLVSPKQLPFINEFAIQVMFEFDLRKEAQMQNIIRETIKDEFPDVIIPRVVPHLVSRGSLVMEFVEGSNMMESLLSMNLTEKRRVLTRLIQLIGRMALIDGRFHGDPHPGNFFWRKDGKICMLDYGQVKEITDAERLKYATLTLTMLIPGRNEKLVANVMRLIGFRSKMDLDHTYAFFANAIFDSVPMANLLIDWRDNQKDPWTFFPSEFVMVMRIGLIMRGLCSLFRLTDISVTKIWAPYAHKVFVQMGKQIPSGLEDVLPAILKAAVPAVRPSPSAASIPSTNASNTNANATTSSNKESTPSNENSKTGSGERAGENTIANDVSSENSKNNSEVDASSETKSN
jgi:predicted unusual protein kinase regulating ubiquinone biosynthesis (AarF/ABC1/UbiB family)